MEVGMVPSQFGIGTVVVPLSDQNAEKIGPTPYRVSRKVCDGGEAPPCTALKVRLDGDTERF